MTHPDHLSMSTSDVLYSADYLDAIALQAAGERRALATELSGLTTAWQAQGRVGFTAFVDAVAAQAQRIETEVTAVAERLRTAAREYTRTDQQGEAALRYRRGPSAM
jgi:uncharacterized protein YukE